MRPWFGLLGLSIGLLLAILSGPAASQGPGASIAFRNETNSPVIVQGVSNVAGMVRRGQPVLVGPARIGGDFNVPAGPRVYSVYDANQPSRVLAKDVPFQVPATGYVVVSVRSLPNNQIVLIPDAK